MVCYIHVIKRMLHLTWWEFKDYLTWLFSDFMTLYILSLTTEGIKYYRFLLHYRHPQCQWENHLHPGPQPQSKTWSKTNLYSYLCCSLLPGQTHNETNIISNAMTGQRGLMPLTLPDTTSYLLPPTALKRARKMCVSGGNSYLSVDD